MTEFQVRRPRALTVCTAVQKGFGRFMASLMVLTLGLGLHVLAPATAEAKEEKPAEGPTAADLRLNLSGVGLPVLQDGRVVNYVFVRLRINLNPGISRPDIEAGEPFVRERMLKAAYRSPLNSGTDLMALDVQKLEAQTLSAARAVYGATRVRSVEIGDQKPQKRLYSAPDSAPASGTRSRQPIRP
jgi:hypothetical protein